MVQPNSRFEELVASKIIKQVCDALLFMHTKSCIHRDLKPENLFLSLVY